MGIKGLPKLINDVAGKAAVRSYKFSKFKNMSISIDASLLIHQTVIAMRSGGHDMTNKKGELTSHLQGIFYKVLIFLQNHIVPIFVFDGKPSKLKNRTLKERQDKKNVAKKRLDELSDEENDEYIKNFKQTFSPTKDNIEQAKILLDLMGVPYIQAPGEADVICAWLAARTDASGKKYVKGVCSDDSDMLPLGAPYLFKDMLRFMKKNKPVKIISLKKTLEKMKLTMEQFVDMCVLIGGDNCESLDGVGPKTAYKLIQEYKTLEKVLEFKELDPTDENYQCIVQARDEFRNGLKEIDQSKDFILTDDQIKLRQFQKDQLMDFMVTKHNFDPIRVQTGLERLCQYYDEMKVIRPNKKNVHKMISNQKYYFGKVTDVDFDSSNEESENLDEDKSDTNQKMPSKNTRSISKLIAPKK